MSSIKQRIQEIKQEIQALEFQLALKRNALQELESLGGKKSRKSSRQSRPPRKGSLGAYIEKILNNSQSSMSVAEIVEALKQQGFVNTANVPLNNLIPSAMSRRPDIFVRVSHGVYDLKSRSEQQINQEG